MTIVTSKEQQFYASLPSTVMPLWTQMSKMVPPNPNPSTDPLLWKYDQLRPRLMEAGELVAAEDAERRVLMLVNPKLGPPHTTDTIYGGLQLVMPGEIAPAHRHTAFALRFIIEGTGGFTAVEGQRIIMTPRNSSYNESARAKQFPRAGEFNLGTILVPRCFAA